MNQIWPIVILTSQFTLSALILLSTIFLMNQDIDISLTSIFSFTFVSIGSFVGGIMTDKIGRQLSLFSCTCAIFLGAILMEYNIYAGLAVAGFGIGPANSISFVIISETYRLRQFLSVVILCGWALGEIILGCVFMLEPTIHQFITLCLMVPAMVISILTFIVIKQTPVFEKKQREKAEENKGNEKTSWIDIAMIKSNLKQLFLGCILMFTLQMFYYRTQFTLDRFGISLTLNTIVVGICQLTTNIICIFIIPRVKRKPSLFIAFVLMTLLFIVLNLIHNLVVQTVIEGLMRILDCFIMALLAVYLPELFPLENRGRGTNFVMSFGVLGGGLSPLILQSMPWWGLLMFNVISITAGLFLKQTFKSSILDQQNKEIQQLSQPILSQQ